MGEAGARNRGFAEAKGEYILFCDSDDTWNNNLLEEVMTAFECNQCDFVRFGSESKDQEAYQSEVPDEGCFSQRDIIVQYFENGKLYSICLVGYGEHIKERLLKRMDLSIMPKW